MRKQGFGRIINISSTSGMYGTPQLATYCMAKWGVRGLTKTLAQELKGTGIVVNTACLPTALKWFPDKSGSISGLVQAGASCGPFIMSPIAQILIDNYGAQMTCRILAVVFLIGIGAVAWMIVPCPEGWLPDGWKPSAEHAKVLNTKNYNIPGMVKTPVFWRSL